MNTGSRSRLQYIIAVTWLVFTVSLALWWMIFGLREVRERRDLGGVEGARLERIEEMLVWEGSTFIGLLVAGGTALLVSIRREQARQRAVEAFFLSFTHDLKTALASLQLQAESLAEDLPDAAGSPAMQRLMTDARRLNVQLENSLYFAQPHGNLLVESVDLVRAIGSIAHDWPELTVTVAGAATAQADRRALDSVLRNLLQNSVVHGRATAVAIRIERPADGRVRVVAIDDGRGVESAVRQRLGQPFTRSGPTSGTGVGLFVSRQLARRMHGDLIFPGTAGPGFTAVLELPAVG